MPIANLKKIHHAMEEQNGISRGQFEKLVLYLQPKSKLQERVFNILSFFNLYGSSLIDELLQSIDVLDFKNHHILEFDIL